MARGAGKNNWALFLLLLAGIVLGSFIAQATSGISALSWLNYGQKFGLTSPFTLDLGILVLTLHFLSRSRSEVSSVLYWVLSFITLSSKNAQAMLSLSPEVRL